MDSIPWSSQAGLSDKKIEIWSMNVICLQTDNHVNHAFQFAHQTWTDNPAEYVQWLTTN